MLTDTIRLLVDTIFYSLPHAIHFMARKRVERMLEYIVIMKEFFLMHSFAWVKTRKTPLDVASVTGWR